MRRITYMIIISLFMTVSCDIHFELKVQENGSSKIFACCTPGMADTTTIIVDIARYVNDKESYDSSKFNIDFYINGLKQEILYNKNFYTSSAIKSGDMVTMEISYPGIENIYAQTQIPQEPCDPEFIIKMPELDYSDIPDQIRTEFILNYTDPDPNTYYAAIFKEKEHYTDYRVEWPEDKPVIVDTIESITWNTMWIGADFDHLQSYPELTRNNMVNNNLVFWRNSDVSEVNERRTITFDLRYIKPDKIIPYYDDGVLNISDFKDYSYEATLYCITEELFNYYYTNLLQSNNGLSSSTMAQKKPVFSNIEGGFGILGGMAGYSMIYDTNITVEGWW
ncbi:MAG: DUF4249 family protein [Bacteroidales bacterium]|nr:DUF4249 family protein [Bacteroidales bacterium]